MKMMLTLFSIAALLSTASHANQADISGAAGVMAHRGCCAYGIGGYAPENTIEAFEYAASVGAVMFETDLRYTSDGEIVIIHDETLNRTTNCTGNVVDHTLAELLACDAGSWLNVKFSAARIPTLVDVFKHCAATNMSVVLDLKVEGLGPGILAALAKVPSLDSVYLLPSVNFKADISNISASLPRSTVLLNAHDYPVPAVPDATFFGDLRAAGVHVIFPTMTRACDANFVASARRFGLQVWSWTVDPLEDWQRCTHSGVTKVCTNTPMDVIVWTGEEKNCVSKKCHPV